MTTKQAISLINNRLQNVNTTPVFQRHWGVGERMKFYSYVRSAWNEIRLYMIIHCNKSPIELVEELREEFDDRACSAKTFDTHFMYSVFYDVTTDVLDILIGEEMT